MPLQMFVEPHSHPLRRLAIGIVCAALVACGGGDSAGPRPSAAPERKSALAAAPLSAGQWSPLIPLSLVPAAAANLPNGKVLLWSSYERLAFGGSGKTYTAEFDPVTQSATEALVTQTGHDMFCPGTTNLSDGSILVNGGDDSNKTSLYNALTGTWSTGPTMKIGRGYQANTLLADGGVLTFGGSWNGGYGRKNAELWTASGGWRLLSGVPIGPAVGPDPGGVYRGDNHIWLTPAPNGQVFQSGPSANMNWIDTSGNGRIVGAGQRGNDGYSQNGNAIAYDVGKLLTVGGSPAYENVAASARAHVIDINAGVSVRQVASMSYPRMFANSVVLPNGQVVVIGGQTLGRIFSDDNSVLIPELWDPVTETFTPLPPMAVARNYHSVALLLPDARVLSGGSGLCGVGCAANHPDLQILTPHYLLNADGSPAVRPVITAAPTAITHGTTVALTADSPIASFALVRMSSVTHSVNNDQRRIPLAFSTTGENRYALSIPSNPGVTLPGYYMLFAMNAAGVPSIAKIVRVGGDGAPTLVNPGSQASVSGSAVQLVMAATSASGAVSFSATGLPAGLQINGTTGLISGTPTTAGVHHVDIAAQNATATTSTQFQWTVTSPGTERIRRYVKLEALSEVDGRPLSSMAEFNILDSNGQPLPRTSWSVYADTEDKYDETEAIRAIDGNPNTFWHTQTWPDVTPLPHWFVVDLGATRTITGFKYLPRPGGTNGTVAGWRFSTSPDGVHWTLVAQGNFNDFPDRAAEKTILLNGVSIPPNQPPAMGAVANQQGTVGQSVTLALAATDADGDTLSYAATGLPPGLAINAATGQVSGLLNTAGTYSVTSQVSDGRGGTASRSFSWTVANAPTPVGAVQFVRLEAVSEVNGKPWTSVAELNLLGPSGTVLPRTGWTAAADSEELLGETAPASRAIDGDVGTFWHTQWSATNPPPPHTLTVNLGTPQLVSGFKYLPRPGGGNGTIGGWRFYTSVNGTLWDLVAQGTFANSATEKVVFPIGGAVVNRLPTLADVASQTGTVGVGVSLALSGADPDADALTYSASGLPAGLGIGPSSGLISGTPTTAGTSNVTAQVADGRGGNASRSFTWTIAAAPPPPPSNGAPSLGVVTNQSHTQGQAVSLQLVATDPDADAIAYSSTNLPTGLQLNPTSGLITGTPTTVGTYAVGVQASDGRGGTAVRSFTWTVTSSGSTGAPVQFVRFEATSEVNGNPWTSAAEFNVLDVNGTALPRAGWTISADSAELVGEVAPAGRAIDGDPFTFWHTQWAGGSPPPPHSLTINLGGPRNIGGFRYLPRPGGGNGTVSGWRFYTSPDGTTWALVAQGTFASNALEKTVYPIGVPAANQLPTLTAVPNQSATVGQAVSFALAGSDADGDTLSYSATGLPTGLTLNLVTGLIAGNPTTAGTYSVAVQVADGRGGTASRSFTWTVATAGGTGGLVQYVRFEAVSEINGNPWTSMAEFNLLDASGVVIPRTGWTVSADSAELVGENAPAARAIDGDIYTFWHTQWAGGNPPPPHAFTVNLGAPRTIGGFRYLPRSGGGNGTVAGWRFYTSVNGSTWSLVGQGTFPSSATEKQVRFP